MRIPIILLVPLVFAGCKMPEVPAVISPYQIDIQQGNVLTQEMVAKLKPGMTRAQVRFALGSPLIVDAFRTDRWDYVYMFQRQGKPTERRNITVIFEDDKLLRIEGDVKAVPPAVKPVAQKPQPPSAAAPVAKPTAENPEAAKSDGAADAAKSGAQAAKPDATKEPPQEEKGFFGRMLDKLGF